MYKHINTWNVTWTHIDNSHDPESVRHPGDDHALRVQRVLGGIVQRGAVSGQGVPEVFQVRAGRVGSPVGWEDAAVLRQERVDHQRADQRSEANEEMQSLMGGMKAEATWSGS